MYILDETIKAWFPYWMEEWLIMQNRFIALTNLNTATEMQEHRDKISENIL